MYKVFHIEGGYQIFWCPHYLDDTSTARTEEEQNAIILAEARPYSKKVYPQKQGAHRRCKQLNSELKELNKMIERDGAIII